MACESCKTVVKQELKKINIPYSKVDFGEVDLNKAITPEQKQKLNTAIKKSGLEILENKNAILIEKIKINIQEFLKHPQKVNFSSYLSEKMKYDYKYLSNLFSIVQAITIEQYIIVAKIDKAKELLLFEDMSLTEISHRLQYSSVAHLSAQFKKINGLNPSHYKNLRKNREVLLNR
jgi:AraC-like DNA-binding protein